MKIVKERGVRRLLQAKYKDSVDLRKEENSSDKIKLLKHKLESKQNRF